MPIIVICPGCQTSYNLPEQFRGKKVRCRKCQLEFASAADAPIEEARLNVEAVDEDDMADAGIRSEAQSAKSARSRRGADDDDGGRARRRWGDGEEPAAQKKSSTLMWVLLGGGGFLLLLLLTCGGIFGFVYYKAHQAAQSIAERIEAEQQEMKQEMIDRQKAMQGQLIDPNNPQQNPLEPNPRPDERQGNRKRQGEYDTLDDALADLKVGYGNRSRLAADWLARTKVEPMRQAEVAQKLEPLLDDQQVRDHAAKALAVWATNENVPALIKALECESGNVKQAAMDTLAKLKDERGAAPLAKHMANFFDRANASKALQRLGPVAEKEVVKYAFDADGGTQTEARKVLTSYQTKDSVYLTQAIEDLKNGDKGRRQNACTWLEKASLDEALRGDVGKALEPLLVDNDRGTRDHALHALKTWASKDNVPALIKLLSHQDGNLRKQSMEILGHLKDERAVAPIGERLLNFFDRETASNTLQKMGSMVEKNEIVEGLNNTDAAVRIEVCRILGACGTARSLVPLQKVAKADKHKDVVLAALNAIREIEGRKVK